MKILIKILIFLTIVFLFSIGDYILFYITSSFIHDYINLAFIIAILVVWYIVCIMIGIKSCNLYYKLITSIIRRYYLIFHKDKCIEINIANNVLYEFNDILTLGEKKTFRYLGKNILIPYNKKTQII